MTKSASKPRIPVCVRFIPEAFDPAWPPITATAPALPAAFRKSPKMANRASSFFFGAPCMITSTIFPESREACLTSSSISKRFTVTTWPSAPPAGVDPVQPMASTCSGLRIGSSNSPCAMPRVHPRQSCYFSVCTFSRPMAFILATPHCSAFLSAGDPVTREPMSSLSSVRYWKACESIIASPAIFTSAGLVPSSSGPFGAGRLSARAIPAPPQENPSATTATLAKICRIGLLLTPSGHTDSITLYRRTGRRTVSFEHGSLLPLLRWQTCRRLHSGHYRATLVPFRLYPSWPTPYTAFREHTEPLRAISLFADIFAVATPCARRLRFPRPRAGSKASRKARRQKGRENRRARENREPRPHPAARNPLPLRSQRR